MEKREYNELTVVRLEEKVYDIDIHMLKKHIFKMPSEIIYFTVNNIFFGCITTGDIVRSKKSKIVINRNCVVLDGWNSIWARDIFLKRRNIHKIPVVNKGILEGDYSRWDDYLFFKRCENDFKCLIRENKEKIYLVKPIKVRNKEMFIKMKSILEDCNISFSIINYNQIIDNCLSEEVILFTDTDEFKGISSIFYKDNFFTYQNFIKKIFDNRYNSSIVFRTLKNKGVHCITINSKVIDSLFCKQYIEKKEKRNKKAEKMSQVISYPMKQEEKEFYGELYDKDYIENISNMFIPENGGSWKRLVSQYNGVNKLKDVQGKFLNVVNGERVTYGQPEFAKRKIYCIGPCIILGGLVGDAYTLESYLQSLCNKSKYNYKVVNLGVFDDKINFPQLNAISLEEGDIVVIFTYNQDCSKYGIDSINLYQMMEDNEVPDAWSSNEVLHVNHKINEILANEIYNNISKSFTPEPEKSKKVQINIPGLLYLNRYFSDVNLNRYDQIGAVVMNCNPFTLGHRYLIEKAYEQVDFLIIFVVEEDKSLYGFEERFAMIQEGTRDLKNIYIVPSGDLLISSTTFPQYFLKIKDEDIVFDVEYDVSQFAEFIAKPLHISARFIGEEPFDEVTKEYNKAMKKILPEKGVSVIEIARKTIDHHPVSASLVRKLLAEGDRESVARIVPESSMNYL